MAFLVVVARLIARRVARILMILANDIEIELDGPSSVANYGLNSMVGAEMQTWLFDEFGVYLPFQKLLLCAYTYVYPIIYCRCRQNGHYTPVHFGTLGNRVDITPGHVQKEHLGRICG